MEKKPAYLKRRTILSGLAGGIMGSQLPSSWKKPIVEAVVLPAHAETSTCTEKHMIGDWEFIIDGSNNPWLFSLYPDGTTQDDSWPTVWRLSGNTFVLDHDGADYLYIAEVEPPCNSMAGEWFSFYPPGSGNWTLRGTWTAKKLS